MIVSTMDTLTKDQINEVVEASKKPIAADEDAPMHSYEYLKEHMIEPQFKNIRKHKTANFL